MVLEFKEGTQLPVKVIYGNPRIVQGVIRDTLSIEVDPSTVEFDTLKSYFKNPEYTDVLYSYTDPSDVNGTNIQYKEQIGVGYNVFVSITDTERLIASPPGQIKKPEIEEVFIVTIAQMTYGEREREGITS